MYLVAVVVFWWANIKNPITTPIAAAHNGAKNVLNFVANVASGVDTPAVS